MKKLFLLVLLMAPAMLAAADRSSMSANPNAGRPSVGGSDAARVGMAMPMMAARSSAGLGFRDMSGGGSSGPAAGCEKDALPDQVTASRCVQKYMACLKMDSVCGANFENCDTKNRFKQKRIACMDKLMECPDEGINIVYGKSVSSTTDTVVCDGETKTIKRTFKLNGSELSLNDLDFDFSNDRGADQNNQIAIAIYEGAQYVANHSVSACKSTAESCIKRACQSNAFKCITGESLGENQFTEIAFLAGGTAAATATRVAPDMVKQYAKNMAYTGSQVREYLRGQCKQDVGTSKSCYIAVNGKMPKDDFWTSDDVDVSMIYNDVMEGTMNLLMLSQSKIYDWLGKSVETAITSCKATASDCVKDACGSGSLAACYGAALDSSDSIHIEQISEVGPRCKGLVNANQNCRDLLVDKDGSSDEIWSAVWGTSSDGYNGAFGLVHELNGQLAQMFNQNTVRNLFVQCRNETEACVRRECGSTFQNCYINDKWLAAGNANSDYGQTRVDGMGAATATANAAGGFDELMAKSLCLIPVKRSETCQNYFDIEYAKTARGDYSWGGSWGGMSGALAKASGWSKSGMTSGPNGTTKTSAMCSAAKNYSSTTQFCPPDDPSTPNVNESLNCTTTYTAEVGSEMCASVENNIFTELIADIGQTARAQLAKEQNKLKQACENNRANSSLGNLYVWATKPQNIVGNNYSAMGLDPTDMGEPTADLWGAFCRVKVSLTSSDTEMRKILQDNDKKTDAYFSLGDAVMCGSWLSQDFLNTVETEIRKKASDDADKRRDWASQNAGLIAGLVGAVAGGVGGGFAGNFIGKKLDEKENKKDDPYPGTSVTAFAEEIKKAQECMTHVKNNIAVMTGGKWKKTSKAICKSEGTGGVGKTVIIYEVVKDEGPGANNQITGACNDTNYSVDDVKCQEDGALKALDSNVAALEKAKGAKEGAVGDSTKGADWGTGIGAGVGALALGLGAGFMTQSIADKNHELEKLKKEDEAVAAWFNSVGSKIKCVVGNKEVGTYGQTIELK